MSAKNVTKSVALYYFNGKAWVPWQGSGTASGSNIVPVETLALYVFNGQSYIPWDGTFPGSGGGGGAPSGPAGGDLSGTYPDPTVHQVNGGVVPTSQAYVGTDASGHIVAASTPSGGITQLTGDVTAGPGTGSQAATLVNTAVTPGSYTNANITVDHKGRITTATNGTDSGITQLTGDVTAGPGSGSQASTLSATAVTPGTYTNTNLTVDSKGRITSAANGSTAPIGAAGGDLSGTYPNPTVHQVNGGAVPTSQAYIGTDGSGHLVSASTPPGGTVTHTGTLTAGQIITGNGGADIEVGDLSGDVTTSGSTATTLANTAVTPGSYTLTNLTVDAKGRITAAANGSGGSGTVTHTGSLTSGQLLKGNGGADITVGDLTGDVTTSATTATTISNNAVTTAKINNAAVTLAKVQNATANSKLLGSGSAGSGASYSEITLGSGLSMSGTTLSSAGGAAITFGSTAPSPAFIQSSTGSGSSIVLPLAVILNDILVVAYNSEGTITSSTISDNLGTSYTLVASTTANPNRMKVWVGSAPSTGVCTITIGTPGANFDRMGVVELAGVTTTVDATTVAYNGTTPVNTTITTLTASDAIVACVAGFHSSCTYSFGGNFVLSSQSNGSDANAVGYVLAGATGVYTLSTTVTAGAADNSPTILVALKPVTPPAGSTGDIYFWTYSNAYKAFVFNSGTWHNF